MQTQETHQAGGPHGLYDRLTGTERRFLEDALAYDRTTVYKVLHGQRENTLIVEYATRLIALREEMEAAKAAKVANDKAKTQQARTAARTRKTLTVNA